jgi:phosphoribosylaminoimidazole-succinocarboxamide synthase
VIILYKKGKLLNEGKTKRVYEVVGNDKLVIIQNKDDITKKNDPKQTREMNDKAKLSTTITCVNFELLEKAGVPVAYLGRISETEFLAKKCQMIPLEVVVRRHAVGSILRRNPELKKSGKIPLRFDELHVEFFLKTTGGVIRSKKGKEIGKLIDQKTREPIDDPLIINPKSQDWVIKNPEVPSTDHLSFLCTLFSEDILPDHASIVKIESFAYKTFLILEDALILLNLRLIDFKLEFGIGPDGELFIADVIDNDSWRIRTSKWQELSKELFRQNKDMKEIKEGYELVARKLEAAYPLKRNRI